MVTSYMVNAVVQYFTGNLNKIAEFKREVTKTIEDNAESQRKEMLENKHLRDEECLMQRTMIEKLKEEITH